MNRIILWALGPALAALSCGGTGSSSFIPGTDGGHDGTVADAPHITFESGGGKDGQKGGNGTCNPLTCKSLGYNCGPAGDGCGGGLDCGSCTAPETCGGGGKFSQCGGSAACIPKTCKDLGINCGPAGDGCGGALSCGTCTAPDICGGGGMPSVCGDAPSCTGLCKDIPPCEGGTTVLKGQVVAGTLPAYLNPGDNPDPVPNVLVYIPNGTPAAFTDGPSCGCADVTGDPLPGLTANTDYQGNFMITGIPVPPSGILPLVIQLGSWRRVFGLGNVNNPGFPVTACSPSNDTGPIHMPRNKGEGDIPLTAVSTGDVDAMECVLLKMGVDQAEFTNPGAGGRIQLFQGNGEIIDTTTPSETSLVPSGAADAGGAELAMYDQVIFPCWGEDPRTTPANQKSAGQLANVINYSTLGGRMFGTHYSYSWLYNNAPFSSAAAWKTDTAFTSGTGNITNPSSYADVTTFYQWMNALPTGGSAAGQFNITAERNDFTAPAANTELWVSITGALPGGGAFPVTFTFDTPYSTATPPPAACGKVIYSDFHVTPVAVNGGHTDNVVFPKACDSNEMTAQEKSLEYLIWDLASCPPGPPPPSCTPGTCKSEGFNCGVQGDGCGGMLDCGTCTGGYTCGGGGSSGKCGAPDCTPKTCAELGFNCGPAGDGCGGSLDCGTCASGTTCGGGGTAGVCGSSGNPK